jgi:hypothetical protein
MVSDEGTAALRKEEEFAGHGVRLFKRSWLLGAIPELSNGTHEIRGPLKHFGLYCLNHIVDVLAYEAPIVRDLGCLEFESGTPKQTTPQTPTSITPRAGAPVTPPPGTADR